MSEYVQEFKEGDWVVKLSGDYYFRGEVVAVFQKLNDGPWRYVVQNEDGVLHIFSDKQLTLRSRQ